MAGKTERTIGQNNIGIEGAAQTPLAKARQEFIGRLEGLDVKSEEFTAIEDHVEFWDEYYQKGYYAFRTDSSKQFLADVEERRKDQAYRELALKVPEIVSDFSRELTEEHRDNRLMTPSRMKALVISELKGMKDQVKERKTQQPPTTPKK